MDAATRTTRELRRALERLPDPTDLDAAMRMVAEHACELVGARALVVELEIGVDLVVVAAAGDVPAGLIGERFDREHSAAGYALRARRTQRLDNAVNRSRYDHHGLGRRGLRAEAGLIVPLVFDGALHGALIAIDRREDGPGFSSHDERLLESFAAGAAAAVAAAKP